MTPRPGNHPEDTPSATGYPAKVSVKASKQQKAAATNAWQAYLAEAERTQREQRELVRASLLAPRADDHHREAA
jgi:hypothetical protein